MPQGSSSSSGKAPRPIAQVPMRLGNIPKELKKLDRWILWKYSYLEKTNKWTKTPHSPVDGHKIDATDFNNGVDFVTAVQALKGAKNRFDGLGFLLGAGIAGIDVDDCIDSNGNLDDRGARLSAAYKETYAEVSPSGQGFKILVNIGDDPKLAVIGKNIGDTEIYGGNRYFTVTGGLLPGHKTTVAPMAEAFASTAESMGAKRDRAPANVAAMPDGKHGLGIDLKAARELVDHLPFSWIDGYSEWLKGGMALHHEFNGSEEALELWDEWSQRNPEKYELGACALKWETFGKPGKDEVTVRTLIRDAQMTGWRAPSTIANAIRDFSPFDEPNTDVDEDGVTGAPDWWARYSVAPFLSQTPQPKRWVWKNVLRQGKVMVLAGSGGSSKSYLMLGAAVQYALGNDWGPFQLDTANNELGRVLLMYGEEDAEDVHDRTHILRHTFMLTEDQIADVGSRMAVLPLRGSQVQLARMTSDSYDREVEMTEALSRLEQRVQQYNIKLVVLDPLAMFHSLEENDNVSIAALMAGLDSLCVRQGCSLIIVHHFGKVAVNKAAEVNESNVRGASALVAHARTVVVMHRLREDEAQEWGVPEADHARWVMWAIVKNNYGPSGARTWFNVDEHTGAISPAPVQLIRRSLTDIRAAVQAARDELAQQEFTDAEERKAQKDAEEEILLRGRVHIFLKYAEREGKIPTINKAKEVLAGAGQHNVAVSRCRAILERIKSLQLVDTDGMLNTAGREFLERHEMLS